MSGSAVRVPCFTAASNSVDRLMRLCAESTATTPGAASGRQRATTLTAPAGHDGSPRPGTHPQSKTVDAGSAPVVRLKGPLALGHGVLLAVSGINHPAAMLPESIGRRWSRYWPARSPHRWSRSQPYRRLSGDFLRVLTSLRPVKPHRLLATAPSWWPGPNPCRPTTRLDHDHELHHRNTKQRLAAAPKTVSFGQCRSRPDAAVDNEAKMAIDSLPRQPFG